MTTIGIITNDQRQVFQRDVIAGVRAAAEKQACTVLVDSIAEDAANPQPVSLPIDALDGVIVIANVLDDARLHNLHATGVPVTLVSHRVKGLPLPSVIPNNADGLANLVDYLVGYCDRRTFAFIQGNMNQHDGSQRDRIFRRRLMFHDLDIAPTHVLRGDFEADIAAQSMHEFLQTQPVFDALVASDYLMALAALDVMREHGVNVPKEVCVVGFGDAPEAEAGGLTTVAADIVELGQRAARQLLAQMNGLAIQGVTWLNTTVIERQTSKRRSRR